MDTSEFIIKAKKIHNNFYNYENVKYVNSKTKVKIICPIHGEFEQTPNGHLSGRGCPICNSPIIPTTKEWIEKAIKIHGYKYDYSKVEYVKNSNKVTIICPIHGEFQQIARNHLNGAGCPKCGKNNMIKKQQIKLNDFIKRAEKIHGKYYDYSKVKYNTILDKVTIICPKHGSFEQSANAHINNGQGCPKCGYEKISKTKSMSNEEFIKKSNEKHNNKYSYSKTNYINYDKHVIITCPIHGDFQQTPDSHLQSKGCPICGYNISLNENEIFEYLKSYLGDKILRHSRNIIKPYEIDMIIPESKIGIEYHGLRWHSTQFKEDKNYHLNKLLMCKEKGYKLIQIFEDEYINNKEIVLSKIIHILGLNNKIKKIFARKCIIKNIDFNTAKEFLNNNHIQGYCKATVYLGCFYNENLIGVMTFKKEKNNKWELNRYASNINYVCYGVGGKLFKYFIKNYNPEEIKSFADRRWTINEEDNLYIKLGFSLNKILKPDYKYVINNVINRIHKFNFRKNILSKKYNLPLTITENEMSKIIGAYKIYDCGLLKYIWKKEK